MKKLIKNKIDLFKNVDIKTPFVPLRFIDDKLNRIIGYKTIKVGIGAVGNKTKEKIGLAIRILF